LLSASTVLAAGGSNGHTHPKLSVEVISPQGMWMETMNKVMLAMLLLGTVFVAGFAPQRESGGSRSREANPSANRARATKGNEMNTTAAGRYASVNGLKMYYEIHGTGEPLVVLHGGVGAQEMFAPLLPSLVQRRQVIGIDLQGHGRTADIDRPLRYELMGDDIAALLKELQIERADFVGYSLGAGAALRTAIQHRERVRKLVIISTTFRRDGWYPEILAAVAQIGPETAQGIKQSPWYKLYPNVNWPVLFTKLSDLLKRDYDWSKEVATITAPIMIVFADADAIRPAHIVEFYSLLGGGQKDAGSGRPTAQLAILPGSTHYNILSAPALVSIVPPFLDGPTATPPA
jgi:pimeloyl-ACP methyl ester carboxylesterase